MNNILDIAFKSMHLSDFVLSGKSGNFVTVEDLSIYASQEDLSGKSTVYVDGTKTDLSICKVSLSDYVESVVYESIDPQVMYIVSSDHVDAFGQQLKNLRNGTDVSDAVNLGQLLQQADNFVSSIGERVQTKNVMVLENFMQCPDESCVSMSENVKTAFVQVDGTYGKSYVGTKGYCILEIDKNGSTVLLSGARGDWPSENEPATIHANSFSYNGIFTASAPQTEDGNFRVTIQPNLLCYFNTSDWNNIDTHEKLLSEFERGSNLFYFPNKPEIGNQESKYVCQNASGSSVKAIQNYAHVEGRRTVADGRYSHAEGSTTKAYGLASHAEGYGTQSFGNYAHSEGYNTSAYGDYTHAGGINSVTKKYGSFVYGLNVSSDAVGTVGLGHNTVLSNDRSFAWSSSDEKYGSKGWGTFCVNPNGGTDGFYIGDKSLKTFINEASANVSSLTDLKITSKFNNFQKAQSGGAVASGDSSIARGDSATSATATQSTAIGKNCRATQTRAIAHGENISSLGTNTIASGKNVQITTGKTQTFAQGENVSALASYSFVVGTNVKTEHDKTFVWCAHNGSTYGSNINNVYTSHGANTFNICPGTNFGDDPKKKFYIGNQNFPQNVIDVIRENAEAIKTILGITS